MPAIAAKEMDDWISVYPQVLVNGAPVQELARFIANGDVLYADVLTLQHLGIRLPQGVVQSLRWVDVPSVATAAGLSLPPAASGQPPSTRLFELASVSGLQLQYDPKGQTLGFTAPLSWLELSTTQIGRREEKPYVVAQPGFAAVLNYDAHVSRNNEGNLQHGLLRQWRLTSPWGFFSHSKVWNRTLLAHSPAITHSTRLDTYWRSSWPGGISLTLGDALTSQLGDGSGGTRIGGIRLEHRYDSQPWRSITPLASYAGATTLPSTIELYLNGARQYSQQVPAGPYEINMPPGLTGRGMAQIVATDVLGRTVVVDMALYGASNMLSKGLYEWSIEAGYLRKAHGDSDSGYERQRPVGSATWRQGLSNWLTLQLHTEGTHGYAQSGAAANLLVGSLGQLNLSHSRSRLHHWSGQQSSASFGTQTGRFSLNAGWSRTEDAFAYLGHTLPSVAFSPAGISTRSVSGALGWNAPLLGSFSLSYVRSRRGSQPGEATAVVNWSRNLGRSASVFVGASKAFHDERRYNLYAGLNIALDQRYALSTHTTRYSDGSSNYQGDLHRSSPGMNSPGWSLGAQTQVSPEGRRQRYNNARLHYETPYGDGWAQLLANNGAYSANLNWRGALVFMQASLFASRSVNDSFAVVSTSGVPKVPVYAQGNAAGLTNRKGLLLVPTLAAWQPNRIHIDTLNLPADMRVERDRAEAVPGEHSGMVVSFEMRRTQSGRLSLKSVHGPWLPTGSTVIDASGQPVSVVGFDGETFIEHLEPGRNHFVVSLPGHAGLCRFDVDYLPPYDAQTLPNLGEHPCTVP